MGIGLADIEYLSNGGYLKGAAPRLLDIGSQCLLNAAVDRIKALMARHPGPYGVTDEEAAQIAYFSTPRPGERTAYLSELLALTCIAYRSYDIVPALKTTIFDLNTDRVPAEDQGSFDVVLNCGTTEHVINQWNAFGVMHDATRIGGVMIHQVPSAGYLDHGYFCYHENFFRDLAKANRYEVEDLWYSQSGQRLVVRPETPEGAPLPNTNINVVLRKMLGRPFAIELELATAHGAHSIDHLSNVLYVVEDPGHYSRVSGRVLLSEVGRRLMKRLRFA